MILREFIRKIHNIPDQPHPVFVLQFCSLFRVTIIMVAPVSWLIRKPS